MSVSRVKKGIVSSKEDRLDAETETQRGIKLEAQQRKEGFPAASSSLAQSALPRLQVHRGAETAQSLRRTQGRTLVLPGANLLLQARPCYCYFSHSGRRQMSPTPKSPNMWHVNANPQRVKSIFAPATCLITRRKTETWVKNEKKWMEPDNFRLGQFGRCCFCAK